MSRRYPSDWDERRKRVYRRDDYTCQHCGARGGRYGDTELHAHHVVPISAGGGHRLDNLTTLCFACHDAVHEHDLSPTVDSDPDPVRDAERFETLTGVGVAGAIVSTLLLFVAGSTGASGLLWVALAVFLGAALYEGILAELKTRPEYEPGESGTAAAVGIGVIVLPVGLYVLVTLFGWPTAVFIAQVLILYVLYRI